MAEAFREVWLAALSRREDWPAFRAAWSPSIKGTALRCAELDARQATGAADAQWTGDAQALWRSSGKPLPDELRRAVRDARSKGGLPPALRWERIEKAAGEWNAAVMRSAARGLPADELALANDYAAFMDAVQRTRAGVAEDRSAAAGSPRRAWRGWRSRCRRPPKRSCRSTRRRWASPKTIADACCTRPRCGRSPPTNPNPRAGSTRCPASAYDDKLHEWRVREAMARSDWRAALAAIRKMGDKQRADSRWTYFAARLSELTGDKAGAQAAVSRRGAQAASSTASSPPTASTSRTRCARGFRRTATRRRPRSRAIRRSCARWRCTSSTAAAGRNANGTTRCRVSTTPSGGLRSRSRRTTAGSTARCSRSAKHGPDEQRLYQLRFPLHHDATIRREAAKNNLDPAWIAAEIRAESVFDPNARSRANAMGLMQVLPGTGMEVARQLGVPWGGANSLYDADTNIILGSAYLRQLLDKYGGQPYFAIAGYNAGPAPLARWQSQRPGMDPDFWIETISYKETRDYVARVLAFSTLYDWRLNGNAVPLSDRMRGRSGGARKRFACPLARRRSPARVDACDRLRLRHHPSQ